MLISKSTLAFSCAASLIALSSCGLKKKAGGTIATQVGLAGGSTALGLSPNSNVPLEANLTASADRFGQTSATSLKSLKYYIQSITICESMDTTGTAFSNQNNCLELFHGNTSDDGYTYTISGPGGSPSKADYDKMLASARASDSGFIDLMSATDRAKLGASIQIKNEDGHSYNYGSITWYLPYKVAAEISMFGTDGVAAGTYRSNDGAVATGSSALTTTATTPFDSATTATSATLLFPNGGNWFKFQNPMLISDDDIKSQTNFKLALVFNPDGMVKGWSPNRGSSFSGCSGCTFYDANKAGIQTPMLGLIPIPFKEGQSVAKEVYQGKLSGTTSGVTNNATVRLELYYVKGDPAKTIYGAQAMALVRNTNGITQDSFYPLPNISFIKDSGGKTDFQIWSKTPIISSFTRKSAKGEKTDVNVECGDLNQGGWQFTGCSAGGKIPVTLELTDIVDVAS